MIHETDRFGTATSSTPLNRGPQPGWMTLNQARDRGFTGEIVFETEPEVRAYLDNGAVYFAERDNGESLVQRLVDSGVVDHGQIERGTVRVGTVEHLGRLFEREPSVDRDAVLVVTEALTEALVTELANEVITTVRSTAYRHHPSGLHRWFAVPVEATPELSAGTVVSLEPSALDDLPGLPMIGDRLITDQLYIEWDEPVIGGAPTFEEPAFVESFDDSALEAMLDEAVAEESMEVESITSSPALDVDEADEAELLIDFDSVNWAAAETLVVPIHEPADDVAVDVVVDVEFDVVWPSGAVEAITAEEVTDDTVDEIEVVDIVDEIEMVEVVGEVEEVEEVVAAQEVVAVEEPVTATTADELSMTPIETFDDEIVADVPADVADAVKRALAALESATFAAPTVAPIMQPGDFEQPAAAVPAAVVAAPVVNGFAPPSLDMSAEAMYARMAAEQAPVAAESVGDPLLAPVVDHHAGFALEAHAVGDVAQAAVPSAGIASVVFVDDEAPEGADGGANERSSALRRLIGSLRRKDR